MEITCPQCDSKFNLPDNLAKPGAKLRCSQCNNVFQIPGKVAPAADPSAGKAEPPVRSQPLPDMEPRPKSRSKIWVVLGLAFALAAGAGTWLWTQWEQTPGAATHEVAKKVEKLTMRNVRQYNILNEKAGKVFVIEGKAVNEFPEPKELIELEGAIYDKDKKPLSVKRQLAGTQLSLFQLQVLSEKEMESFLNNKVELLANNTNIPPGGEVPFMILFYDPPDNIAEFGVEIVDVKDVPAN